MNIQKRLGRQIRELRKERGWTQEELGELCGVKRAHISKIENGVAHPSMELIFKMGEIFERDLRFIESRSPEGEMFSEQIPCAQFYPTREAAYSAVPPIIERVSTREQEEKYILHAALHGHTGRRIPKPFQLDPALKAFDDAMHKCIVSPEWQVREIFNITNEERLEMVLEHLEETKDSENYELRAVSLPDAPSLFSPLVIGSKDFLIGWEELRYFRIRCAIHLHGEDFAKMGSEYFDALWLREDQHIFVLKSEAGMNLEEIDKLHQKIREKENKV